MALQYDPMLNLFQIVQIAIVVFGGAGMWFTIVGRVKAVEGDVDRHERKLEALDDINGRLIRIEEKVDALRSGASKGGTP